MKSDFEIIIDILQSSGSLTAREIAKLAKNYGKQWVRKDANSNLYKMLMQELVKKDSSEKVPKWSLTTVDPSKVRNEVTNSEQILNKVRKYLWMNKTSRLKSKVSLLNMHMISAQLQTIPI